MTAELEGVDWSAARPGPHFTPGKTRYPFYRRLGTTKGQSGQAENLIPTGIRSWTVQPVVSRYTDRATRPTHTHTHTHICIYISCGALAHHGSWPHSEVSRSHQRRNTTQSVALLRTSDRLVVETSTWQHTTLTTDKQPCLRRYSNPQSQQQRGRWDRPKWYIYREKLLKQVGKF